MSSKRPRVLFACHSASRNGASLLLLHFLQWLPRRVDWDVDVLLDGPGPLLDAFKAVARVTVLRNWPALACVAPHRARAAMERRMSILSVRAALAGRRFDLVYANTSAAWPCVEALSSRVPAVVWHIHELDHVLRLTLGEDRIRSSLEKATRIVAVSESVRDALLYRFGVRREVDVIAGFVATDAVSDRAGKRERIRRALGWPADAFIVGGCGSLGWRKGTDVFVQAALAMRGTGRADDVRFLWIGGTQREQATLEFDQDVRTLGLTDQCKRIPATADVDDYYCAMDAFALTSREDPFPLVMLEAAAHGLPVVCFAGSGGGPEFVGDDAGLVAPYLDLEGYVGHLRALRREPSICAALGAAARQRVRQHHRIDSKAMAMLRVVQSCLSDSRGSSVNAVEPGPDLRRTAREDR